MRPIVLGGGAVPFRRYRDGSNWRDWVRQAGEAALADAELAADEIDSVVVASETDFFSLQVNPGPIVLDELGLTGRGVVRVEAGGASGGTALRVAFSQIMAGLAKRVLVVGFEASAGSLAAEDVQLIYGLSFDAEVEGMAGATAAALYALSISLHMAAHGTTAEQIAAVSVKNHGHAIGNPLAHSPMEISVDDVLDSPMVATPYRRFDCSLVSDGAAAIVLAHPCHAPRGERARSRIAGSGAATDHARLGDRHAPQVFAAKVRAAREAYEMAGIGDPATQIQVAEVYDAFTGAELQGLEALGLAAPGRAGAAMADGVFGKMGALPVNLSGGLIGQGGAPGAVGIVQAMTMDRILTSRHPGADISDLRVGLVDAHGGVCTSSAVHVLERIEP
ncbi:MAG: thiolase family protein [Methyloligellaceae bacterium]